MNNSSIALKPNHEFHIEYTEFLEHMLEGNYSLEDFIRYAGYASNDPDWLSGHRVG